MFPVAHPPTKFARSFFFFNDVCNSQIVKVQKKCYKMIFDLNIGL